MLATEPATPDSALLETWSHNERMRHIPLLSWMIDKIEIDVRRRFEILFTPFSSLEPGDPRHAPIDAELRALIRALDRVADVAKRPKNPSHPPNDIAPRMNWSINHAVGNLQGVDPETFAKRFPFQTFERSNAEPLTAAMLAVIAHLQKVHELVRAIDPAVDERIYANLVTLNEPMRSDAIA